MHIDQSQGLTTNCVHPHTMNEKQAAEYIGMSRSFLAIARMDGTREGRTPGPPFVKVGRRVLYLKEDLDNWLLSHRVDGNGRPQ